ncbi:MULTISPECIES: hypothetical protein [Rhizobium]|uniref:Transposase n=1 Tax=Rhizobium rhododendri TaxID=2506430 RepID=A0ABY8ILG1_9HYPH|nr:MULTISPECIES: hypothetical protein [Rhizobium]MBO9098482.1 hypothetical protein [Rhizobium sp. L58/93]MBO9132714.1 hypothetical protein [Rhizobium sp. B209b/85]MBO9168748.1 hypothetical protein [Rhizobium sp. L245/93]MBO9184698.1 hypothetical protein [Rhizobium sp. E27B/91]MBZ5758112.1 hypothetical protein [Rhizobium sp. VS19-DR96]
MAVNENSPDISVGGGKGRPKAYALHPLHEAAMRIAEIGRGRSRSKTKDLIGVLLCHGARAWRYSQPEARIHLHVSTINRQAPVLMRLR